MITKGGLDRDLAALVVPPVGRLVATGDRYEPYQLIDPGGAVVDPVTAYFRDFWRRAGRSRRSAPTGWTCSGGSGSAGRPGWRWDRATRTEARDFCRWLLVAGKPSRPHWRQPGRPRLRARPAGEAYAASVRAHSETVLRGFLRLPPRGGQRAGHQSVPAGPLSSGRTGARASQSDGAAHNERSGLYRPRLPARIPRSVPDAEFNEIFARLPSHRDRALVAFYVSTGARASELLSATVGGVDPGRQLITVVRKGTGSNRNCPLPPTRSYGCGSTRWRWKS